MSVYETETWSVEVPDGWTVTEDDECVSFTAGEPIGALQVSAYLKDGQVTNEDLEELAEEHLTAGAQPETVDHPTYEGFGIAYEVDEEFWTEWFLRNGNQAIYATYNCPVGEQDAESEVVGELLSTLVPIMDDDDEGEDRDEDDDDHERDDRDLVEDGDDEDDEH